MVNDETRAFIAREIEKRPEIAELATEMETATEGGDDELTELLAPIFTLDEAPEVVRLRARVAELEGQQDKYVRESTELTRRTGLLRSQTADLKRQADGLMTQMEAEMRHQAARADTAEAQVARMTEAMALVPEAPRAWGDDTRMVWLSGWAAACRHVREALHPSAPADGIRS